MNCKECGGTGKVKIHYTPSVNPLGIDTWYMGRCLPCKGTGKIPEPTQPTIHPSGR